MKMISLIILLFCLPVSVGLSNSDTSSNEMDICLRKMFAYANDHNVRALEEMSSQIKLRNNKLLTNAYSLALYIASPKKYKQQYVDAFPTDYEGIMYELYERIELKKLTPKFLYSIESIGLIAEEGNEKAIGKVLNGNIHSDGVVSELFCGILAKLFARQTQKTLKCLSRLDKEQRDKNYSCFNVMDSREFALLKEKLKRMRSKISEAETIVLSEIENYQ